MKIKNLIFLIIFCVALSILIIFLIFNKTEKIQTVDFENLINNDQLEINILDCGFVHMTLNGLSFDQFLLDLDDCAYHFNSNELKGSSEIEILNQFNKISLEKFKLNLDDLTYSPMHKFRKTILGFSIPLNPFLFYPLYKNKYENAFIYAEFYKIVKFFIQLK